MDSDLNSRESGEDHWIPLADLMTSLMLVFLLIAIAYMVKIEKATQNVSQVASSYQDLRQKLYTALDKEFHRDLPSWGAELDPDLTIRFTQPEVLFDTGKAELKPRFQKILDQFVPRYLLILSSREYKNSIQELRIEGHTSSIWTSSTKPEEAYIFNMKLSQDRTRSTLQYILTMPSAQKDLTWLHLILTANGLSSSHVISFNGHEDQLRSQRVEFRIRTNADERLQQILEKMQLTASDRR
jgi:outer membrane protein OmpA-like peptidoglycan-associated protein